MPLLQGSGDGRSEDAAQEQERVTRRYDRAARFYDFYDAPMEWMGGRRRRTRLWQKADGRILEIGVGTGKNLAHYPAGSDITGIDVSEQMLQRARRKQARLGIALSRYAMGKYEQAEPELKALILRFEKQFAKKAALSANLKTAPASLRHRRRCCSCRARPCRWAAIPTISCSGRATPNRSTNSI